MADHGDAFQAALLDVERSDRQAAAVRFGEELLHPMRPGERARVFVAPDLVESDEPPCLLCGKPAPGGLGSWEPFTESLREDFQAPRGVRVIAIFPLCDECSGDHRAIELEVLRQLRANGQIPFSE